jgi:hypothetical protein
MTAQSIYLAKRCILNRWVSYFLLLLMLPLQLVFCGCGAIAYSESCDNHLPESSTCKSLCPCGHHQAPVSSGIQERQKDGIGANGNGEKLLPFCDNCVRCQKHGQDRHHSHQVRPTTRSEPRVDSQWLETCGGFPPILPTSTKSLLSGRYQGPGFASWLVRQTLVARLRI